MIYKYPNGQSTQHQILTKRSHKIDFGKRGMSFEEEINQSNQYYLQQNIAVIHKKPTPIQIVSVDYPKRSAAVIKEAYFRQASTTDYNGIYKGYYLDFEAKETKNKTSFPLRNLHEHQMIHMQQCHEHGGISFVLLYFSSLKRYFFVTISLLRSYWYEKDRKSIPLTVLEKKAYEIHGEFVPRIPFLKAVDYYIEREMKHGAK